MACGNQCSWHLRFTKAACARRLSAENTPASTSEQTPVVRGDLATEALPKGLRFAIKPSAV